METVPHTIDSYETPQFALLSSSLLNYRKPHWAVTLALTVLMFDLFQALLLEHMNDSITTLEKNLEM